jgi:hypothetical protein
MDDLLFYFGVQKNVAPFRPVSQYAKKQNKLVRRNMMLHARRAEYA